MKWRWNIGRRWSIKHIYFSLLQMYGVRETGRDWIFLFISLALFLAWILKSSGSLSLNILWSKSVDMQILWIRSSNEIKEESVGQPSMECELFDWLRLNDFSKAPCACRAPSERETFVPRAFHSFAQVGNLWYMKHVRHVELVEHVEVQTNRNQVKRHVSSAKFPVHSVFGLCWFSSVHSN